MTGYQSKKFLAESREPNVPNFNDIKMEAANPDLFYNLRHLKTFKENTKQKSTVWSFRWPVGEDIVIFDKVTGKTLFTVGHDPHFAEYLVSLHNMSERLIKEVESKYDGL